jgi:hypothetical protein
LRTRTDFLSSLDFAVNTSSSATPPQREGLPASYKMRADAHYVDQLDRQESAPTFRFLPPSRFSGEARVEVTAAFIESVRQHGVLQPLIVRRDGSDYRMIDGRKRLAAAIAAGAATVPCLVHHIDADAAAALETALRVQTAAAAPAEKPVEARSDQSDAAIGRGTGALLKSLAQLNSCSALLDHADHTQRTLAEIVRVEAARSWCIATMLPIAAETQAATEYATTRYPLRRLFERVVALCEHERRLRAVQLETKIGIAEATEFAVTPDVVVAALGGVVLSAFELCGEQPGARFEIAAAARGSDGCVVSVAGPRAARQPEPVSFAGMMLAAAKLAATLFGGRLTTQTRESGTIYSMNFAPSL